MICEYCFKNIDADEGSPKFMKHTIECQSKYIKRLEAENNRLCEEIVQIAKEMKETGKETWSRALRLLERYN